MSQALAKFKAALASSDPAVKEMVKAANEELLRIRFLSPGAVAVSAPLANLAMAYSNEEYIGTKLLPILPVKKMAGIIYKLGRRDRRAVPPAEVGPRSSVNEVEATYGRITYSVQPIALKGQTDALTSENEDLPLDLLADTTATVSDSVDLVVEKNISTVLNTAANYGSNTITLSGSDQWNSSAGGSPIQLIQNAIDSIEVGPGASKLVGFAGIGAANMLRRHPLFLDMFKATGQGLVPMKTIANWFGLDDILVGKARQDTANLGQAEASSRIWPNNFGVVRVATAASQRTLSFGWTLRFGQKETMQWYDPDPGARGAYWSKVNVNDDYRVTASDAGFLIVNAVSG